MFTIGEKQEYYLKDVDLYATEEYYIKWIKPEQLNL